MYIYPHMCMHASMYKDGGAPLASLAFASFLSTVEKNYVYVDAYISIYTHTNTHTCIIKCISLFIIYM